MRVFFLTASLIWALAHFYVGRRIIKPLGLSWRGAVAAWSVVALMIALVTASLMLSRLPEKNLFVTAVQWSGYLSMGFFAIVFPLVVVRDLGWLGGTLLDRLIGLVRRMRSPRHETSRNGRILPEDPGRQRFLMQTANMGILGTSGLLTGVGYYEARKRPDVETVSVPIEELPPALEGFRIVQISDTHIGPTIRREQVLAIVETANELSPDITAFTGDLVDGFVPEMRDDVAPIGHLRARYGVFFCTGNHEYYWDLPCWLAEVRRLGLTVLLNEHRLVEHRSGVGGSGRILVAGANDYSVARHVPGEPSDPTGAIRGAPEADVKLLLAHQPRSIYEAARAGYDLQLSGHTHGGQFFPWTFFVGLQQPYTAGLYQHEGTWIYVSRGAGYWGPPLRLGAPSEITLLTLTRAERIATGPPSILSSAARVRGTARRSLGT